MPLVQENLQWQVLEILDGFGLRISSLEAMKIREDYKILVLKEESDSSHGNQTCDKFVAIYEKSKKCERLATLRSAKHLTKGVVDQHGLVQTTKEETWTNEFAAWNLDPRNRMPFPDWCKKIDPVPVGGQMFAKEECLPEQLKIHALLPSF